MPRITSIKVSKSVTIQVKQYHPVTISLEAEAELMDGEAFEDAVRLLREKVHEQVHLDAYGVMEAGPFYEEMPRSIPVGPPAPPTPRRRT